jgi:hypothetical protein
MNEKDHDVKLSEVSASGLMRMSGAHRKSAAIGSKVDF